MSGPGAWIADALVIVGLLTMTLGVVGVFRLPDVYGHLHASTKSVALGIVSLVLAAAVSGGAPSAYRAVLIAAAVLVTAAVSTHAIGRAAWRRGEPVAAPHVPDDVDLDASHDREQGSSTRDEAV